jgi:hypothetical protein
MESLEEQGARGRALEITAEPVFAELDTDARFETLIRNLRSRAARGRAEAWISDDGNHAARIFTERQEIDACVR